MHVVREFAKKITDKSRETGPYLHVYIDDQLIKGASTLPKANPSTLPKGGGGRIVCETTTDKPRDTSPYMHVVR